jgi:hypothetical protein
MSGEKTRTLPAASRAHQQSITRLKRGGLTTSQGTEERMLAQPERAPVRGERHPPSERPHQPSSMYTGSFSPMTAAKFLSRSS